MELTRCVSESHGSKTYHQSGTGPGHGRRKDFSRGRNGGFFQGRPNMVKFHFIHSKLRKQPVFAKNVIEKWQISKSMGDNKALLATSLRCPWTRYLISTNASHPAHLSFASKHFKPLMACSSNIRSRLDQSQHVDPWTTPFTGELDDFPDPLSKDCADSEAAGKSRSSNLVKALPQKTHKISSPRWTRKHFSNNFTWRQYADNRGLTGGVVSNIIRHVVHCCWYTVMFHAAYGRNSLKLNESKHAHSEENATASIRRMHSLSPGGVSSVFFPLYKSSNTQWQCAELIKRRFYDDANGRNFVLDNTFIVHHVSDPPRWTNSLQDSLQVFLSREEVNLGLLARLLLGPIFQILPAAQLSVGTD